MIIKAENAISHTKNIRINEPLRNKPLNECPRPRNYYTYACH